MKKIKILGIITLLFIVLVSCNEKEESMMSKRDTSRKVEETMAIENDLKDNMINERLKEDDIEDLYDLLDDTGEIKDRDLNNEYELVELAEDWVTELAEMNISNEEIAKYTNEWLKTENIKVSRFKEVFPKLNDYALGLIRKDPKTLELYKNSDDDRDELLDDLTIDENSWTEIFNAINATIK